MKLFPIVFAAVVAQETFNDIYTDSTDYSADIEEVVDSITTIFDATDDVDLPAAAAGESFFPGSAGAFGRGVGGNPGIITCFTCNEESIAECITNILPVSCPVDQGVCSATIRERRGSVEHILLKCEDYRSCQDNQHQNFVGDSFLHDQCKPWMNDYPTSRMVLGADPSVCRHCCSEDLCYRSPEGTTIGWDNPLENTGHFTGSVDYAFGLPSASHGFTQAKYEVEAAGDPVL